MKQGLRPNLKLLDDVLLTGVANATFNGDSSAIEYSNTLLNASQEPLITISFRLRTRDSNATILYLQHTVLNSFISVQLCDGKLQISNDSGAFVADGSWHEIAVTYAHNVTSLTVDGKSSDQRVVDNQQLNFVDSSCRVFVGADAENSNHFKGCLGEVRVNSILLPFFMRSELANDTSTERFDAVNTTSIVIGCRGDNVCRSADCHNGTCRDVWNAYECDCDAGFNGTFCQLDIDECAVGHDCENSATCVDGIASYSCICSPGYSGPRYELGQNFSNVLIHQSPSSAGREMSSSSQATG